MKLGIVLLTAGCVTLAIGCKPKPAATGSPGSSAIPISKAAAPLPKSGFKAKVTLSDPPLKLRTGQKEVITVKVKNASDVVWRQRGGEINERPDNKFYIAVGNRWLDRDGKPTSETEGHNGISKDLKPGEEAEMTLQITAPKEQAEDTLNLDMAQE